VELARKLVEGDQQQFWCRLALEEEIFAARSECHLK